MRKIFPFFLGGLMISGVLITHYCFSAERESDVGGFMINYPAEEKKIDVAQFGERTNKSVSNQLLQQDRKIYNDDSAKDSSFIIATLKKQLAMKESKINLLEIRLNRAEQRLEEKESEFLMAMNQKSRLYEVKKGESLWKIAKRTDVYNNPNMWIKIYNANMDKIENQNIIYAGQLFEIPK